MEPTAGYVPAKRMAARQFSIWYVDEVIGEKTAMPDFSGESRQRLIIDPEGYAARERLVAYEIGNTLLMQNLELQRTFGLRAEEFQIFMLIVLSTVQRFARNPGTNENWLDRTPLPAAAAGSISRRRISETLDIPLETVRRTVAGLLARGMIVERSRGCLSTSGGTLARLGEDALPERMARRFLTVSNTMLRLSAARLADSERTAASKREHAASDRASDVERQVSR